MSSSTAYILYSNVLLHGAVTASHVAQGSHPLNATDYRTTTAWRTGANGGQVALAVALTSPQAADCVAIAAHTLAGKCTAVHLQKEDGGNWVTVATTTAIHRGVIWLKAAQPSTSPAWRIVCDVNAAVAFGVVFIGEAMRLPYGMPMGFTPVHYGIKTERTGNMTETGQFAGSALIRKGASGQIRQENAHEDWLRTTAQPWLSYAQSKPFFFKWSGRFGDDAVYCWAANDAEVGGYKTLKHLQLQLNVNAWLPA